MSSEMSSKQAGILGRQLMRRVVLLGLVAVLGFVAFVFIGLGSALQGTQRRLVGAGASAAGAVDEFLGSIESGLLATGDSLAMTRDTDEVLRRALARQPAVSGLALIDPQGQVLAQHRRTPRDRGTALTDQPWLETVQDGDIYIGAVDYGEFGVPFVDVAVAVTDSEGDFSATLVGEVDLTALWDAIIGLEVGETGYVYIVDEEGRLLAHRDLQLVREGIVLEDAIGHTPQDIAASTVNVYEGFDGAMVLASGSSMTTAPWFVLVEQPVREALRIFTLLSAVLLGMLAVVSILVYSIVRFARYRIASPLLLLREGVEILRQGDFEHRIEVQTQDEFGVLADTFNTMVAQLEDLVGSLEQRVAERTHDLERRAVQMDAAAQVAREAAAIRDVGQLLDATSRLISDRFGFYHAGIFLLDEVREYAVLRAASSIGGRRMLARRHKLKVGEVGIVGHAAGRGEPRIALDVGEDAVFFDNPDLPRTRSEMALPLKVRGQVIGVLDVQSTEEAAFSEDDVAILQTMADQLALAIETARLLDESQRALRELETLYGRRAREAWRKRMTRQPAAYRYTGVGVEPASVDVVEPLLARENDGRQLTAPIRLRGQSFGSIVLRHGSEEDAWSPDEIALVEQVSTQIGLALENARLLEETQRRAEEEQVLSEMTTRFTRSLNVDGLLRSAVRELGQLLQADEVSIHVGASEIPSPSGELEEGT